MNNSNESLINWDSIFSYSAQFNNSSPTKFAFIENFFKPDFYQKLYETFPSLETFTKINESDKSAFRRWWGGKKRDEILDPDSIDENLSDSWNIFYKYIHSSEFISNFKKFSNVSVDKTKHFVFFNMTKGGYQYPHIHNVGPSTLILIIYFNKNWPQGDPGGTYLSENEGENIIFEPYVLENSCLIFQDGPLAEHGVRVLEKDVQRKAIQITLQGFRNNKWEIYPPKFEKIEL